MIYASYCGCSYHHLHHCYCGCYPQHHSSCVFSVVGECSAVGLLHYCHLAFICCHYLVVCVFAFAFFYLLFVITCYHLLSLSLFCCCFAPCCYLCLCFLLLSTFLLSLFIFAITFYCHSFGFLLLSVF